MSSSLEGVSLVWGEYIGQRGLASKVSLDHSLKIPVGPKHLSQVFDLLPLCAAITHLQLCALDTG